MDTKTIERYLPADAGCVLDGANRGWRITSDVIILAHVHTFPVTSVDDAVIQAFREGGLDVDGTCAEYVSAMADEAIEWLNEHVAPERHTFGWHEGDLMLWHEETWGDVDHP
jgi:hypothetical protein